MEFLPLDGGDLRALPPRIPASPAPPRPTVVGGRIRRPRCDAARQCLTRLPASFKRHGVAIGVQPDSAASATPMPRAGGWDSVRRRQGTPAPVSLTRDELVRPPTLLHSKCTRHTPVDLPVRVNSEHHDTFQRTSDPPTPPTVELL